MSWTLIHAENICLLTREGNEEARARPCLLIVKGCHSEEEQAQPKGQRAGLGLPSGLLGDSEHKHISMGVLLGATSGGDAVGDSLGQGDLEDVAHTSRRESRPHKAQEIQMSWILFLTQEAIGEQTSAPQCQPPSHNLRLN